MIFEITGMPGSGKSTIIKKLSKINNDDNFVFDIQDFISNKILGFRTNLLLYDLLLLSKFYLLDKNDLKVLTSSVQVLKSNTNSFFIKINIIRNIYKKLIINRFLANYNNFFIVDEGVSHIPVTLFVDLHKINFKELKDFTSLLNLKSNIILIDADDDLLYERVIHRGPKGHRRINFKDIDSIKSFMSQSRIVINYLKSNFNFLYTTKSNSKIDLQKIISIIKNV